jgi:hypothetical protein
MNNNAAQTEYLPISIYLTSSAKEHPSENHFFVGLLIVIALKSFQSIIEELI